MQTAAAMNKPMIPLTLRSISAEIVVVPMARPLWTSAQVFSEAPLLLVDLQTEEGLVGHAYLFCYVRAAGGAIKSIINDISTRLSGKTVTPMAFRKALADYSRLIGQRGIMSMAAAAVDMAAWDALSKAAQLPLVRMLGAEPQPIKAYNSNGLGLISPQAAAEEAVQLLDGGFTGVKMRLGRSTAQADLAAVRAVRQALPDRVALMADFNQMLSPAEALKRCAMLDGEGLYWIEEPIRHDDYASYALLKRNLVTPLQIGENFAGPKAMAAALANRCVDFVMPDAERIGGVSGWIDAAALAAAHDMEISSHLFPEISAHLLAASPTCHWLEYVDWASPILASPQKIVNGCLTPGDAPGCGLAWNQEAVARYRID